MFIFPHTSIIICDIDQQIKLVKASMLCATMCHFCHLLLGCFLLLNKQMKCTCVVLLIVCYSISRCAFSKMFSAFKIENRITG